MWEHGSSSRECAFIFQKNTQNFGENQSILNENKKVLHITEASKAILTLFGSILIFSLLAVAVFSAAFFWRWGPRPKKM